MGPRSLRFRLMLAVALVVLAAVITVGIAARNATASRVERFLAETRALENAPPNLEALAKQLAQAHGEGGWQAAQEWLDGWKVREHPGYDLIVLAPDDRLLATSDPKFVEWRFEALGAEEVQAQRGGEVVQLRVPSAAVEAPGGESLGRLYLFRLPTEGANEISSHQTVFISSISRFVLYSILAAGLAAIALTWVATRGVLKPVEELTDAARHLERGDLSQRVRVGSDDEIGRLGKAFNSMADSLQLKEAALRNMVSDTAHELRTPITNLRCQIEALEDGLVPPDAAALHSLAEEISLLQKLAEDLQVLALADAGSLRIELSACDLEEQASRVVQSVLAARDQPGAEISVELAGLSPALADPERLRQILSNLLLNALDHTPEEGHVRLGGRQSDRWIELYVEDTGIGIAAEHLPRVFERYYRPDPSRQRATGGSGLGLSIVQQLTEAQGGTVTIESESGEGTTVVVTLPRAREQAEPGDPND